MLYGCIEVDRCHGEVRRAPVGFDKCMSSSNLFDCGVVFNWAFLRRHDGMHAIGMGLRFARASGPEQNLKE